MALCLVICPEIACPMSLIPFSWVYDTATKNPRVYVLVHAATPRFTTTMEAVPAAATVLAT